MHSADCHAFDCVAKPHRVSGAIKNELHSNRHGTFCHYSYYSGRNPISPEVNGTLGAIHVIFVAQYIPNTWTLEIQCFMIRIVQSIMLSCTVFICTFILVQEIQRCVGAKHIDMKHYHVEVWHLFLPSFFFFLSGGKCLLHLYPMFSRVALTPV